MAHSAVTVTPALLTNSDFDIEIARGALIAAKQRLLSSSAVFDSFSHTGRQPIFATAEAMLDEALDQIVRGEAT
jgi:hypothetical protein